MCPPNGRGGLEWSENPCRTCARQGRSGGCTPAQNRQRPRLLCLIDPPSFSCSPGSVEASATLTNPLGHAERLNLSGEWGSRSTTTYSLALTRARPRGLPYLATARLYQQFSSFERWSSFTELLRGAETSLST